MPQVFKRIDNIETILKKNMSDLREIYFENERGFGLVIQIPRVFEKQDIFMENEYLTMKQPKHAVNGEKRKFFSMPTMRNDFEFIDFVADLSVENVANIFGGIDDYIQFMNKNNIRLSRMPNEGNWILLFTYR
jgi:hypothetical protein